MAQGGTAIEGIDRVRTLENLEVNDALPPLQNLHICSNLPMWISSHALPVRNVMCAVEIFRMQSKQLLSSFRRSSSSHHHRQRELQRVVSLVHFPAIRATPDKLTVDVQRVVADDLPDHTLLLELGQRFSRERAVDFQAVDEHGDGDEAV